MKFCKYLVVKFKRSVDMKMSFLGFWCSKWMDKLKFEFCCTELLFLYEFILYDEADSDRASILYRVIFLSILILALSFFVGFLFFRLLAQCSIVFIFPHYVSEQLVVMQYFENDCSRSRSSTFVLVKRCNHFFLFFFLYSLFAT